MSSGSSSITTLTITFWGFLSETEPESEVLLIGSRDSSALASIGCPEGSEEVMTPISKLAPLEMMVSTDAGEDGEEGGDATRVELSEIIEDGEEPPWVECGSGDGGRMGGCWDLGFILCWYVILRVSRDKEA